MISSIVLGCIVLISIVALVVALITMGIAFTVITRKNKDTRFGKREWV